MKSYQAKIQQWLEGPYDDETKSLIRQMTDAELEAAFSTNLSFGTAGMRGVVGPGTAHLNIYTIRTATQGLINALSQPKKIAIAYDSRLSSLSFAQEAARVIIGNEIEAHLCTKPMPTPFLSFVCRELHCDAAIMITASHNPPEYNGYKVYWSDGAQVVPPHDQQIIDEVNAITDPSQVKIATLDTLHTIGDDLIQTYCDTIEKLQFLPDQNHTHGKQLKVLYTPLHGVGANLMPDALARWGFDCHFIEAQKKPDGTFPTTKSPNPENPDALVLGAEQIESQNADILLANDPDADRMGAMVMHQGTPRFLTGNEIAILCTDHILRHQTLPANGAIVASIVTTDLLKTLAKAHHVTHIEVLTGFKYIGELIHKWESNHANTFIFGAEESHGYLLGTHARDKDGIVASCLLCEVALDAKLKGQTLVDRLEAIYQHYGYQVSAVRNLKNVPATALDPIRAQPPETLAGYTITSIEDLLTSGRLPKANVLIIQLDNGVKIILRPSGTEPKLKIYAQAHGSTPLPPLDPILDSCFSLISVET